MSRGRRRFGVEVCWVAAGCWGLTEKAATLRSVLCVRHCAPESTGTVPLGGRLVSENRSLVPLSSVFLDQLFEDVCVLRKRPEIDLGELNDILGRLCAVRRQSRSVDSILGWTKGKEFWLAANDCMLRCLLNDGRQRQGAELARLPSILGNIWISKNGWVHDDVVARWCHHARAVMADGAMSVRDMEESLVGWSRCRAQLPSLFWRIWQQGYLGKAESWNMTGLVRVVIASSYSSRKITNDLLASEISKQYEKFLRSEGDLIYPKLLTKGMFSMIRCGVPISMRTVDCWLAIAISLMDQDKVQLDGLVKIVSVLSIVNYVPQKDRLRHVWFKTATRTRIDELSPGSASDLLFSLAKTSLLRVEDVYTGLPSSQVRIFLRKWYIAAVHRLSTFSDHELGKSLRAFSISGLRPRMEFLTAASARISCLNSKAFISLLNCFAEAEYRPLDEVCIACEHRVDVLVNQMALEEQAALVEALSGQASGSAEGAIERATEQATLSLLKSCFALPQGTRREKFLVAAARGCSRGVQLSPANLATWKACALNEMVSFSESSLSQIVPFLGKQKNKDSHVLVVWNRAVLQRNHNFNLAELELIMSGFAELKATPSQSFLVLWRRQLDRECHALEVEEGNLRGEKSLIRLLALYVAVLRNERALQEERSR